MWEEFQFEWPVGGLIRSETETSFWARLHDIQRSGTKLAGRIYVLVCKGEEEDRLDAISDDPSESQTYGA